MDGLGWLSRHYEETFNSGDGRSWQQKMREPSLDRAAETISSRKSGLT